MKFMHLEPIQFSLFIAVQVNCIHFKIYETILQWKSLLFNINDIITITDCD